MKACELYAFLYVCKNTSMLRKERIPDLIVIAVVGLILLFLNYIGQIHIVSDYPFIFLLAMYFTGRAVTWYVINMHAERDSDDDADNENVN